MINCSIPPCTIRELLKYTFQQHTPHLQEKQWHAVFNGQRLVTYAWGREKKGIINCVSKWYFKCCTLIFFWSGRKWKKNIENRSILLRRVYKKGIVKLATLISMAKITNQHTGITWGRVTKFLSPNTTTSMNQHFWPHAFQWNKVSIQEQTLKRCTSSAYICCHL